MKANLMLVSNDDFPIRISDYFTQHEFTCLFARGRLRIKEIFERNQVDAIIWLFQDYDEGLAGDLIKEFNEHNQIPLILITEAYGDSDLSDMIKGVFAHHDINDDLPEIRKSIEAACNFTDNESSQVDRYLADIPEIDFKNAVRHLLTEDAENNSKKDAQTSSLVIEAPWSAVSKKEKKILSGSGDKETKIPFFTRIWKFLVGK